MEIEDDLDTTSRQDILNNLKLHVLVSSFIDIVIHLIEDILNFSLPSSSSSTDKKAISILDIVEII